MTDLSLRMRVVEAVAPQIHANDPAYSPPYWDDCNDDMKRWYRDQATAALDAMLDCLAENLNETVQVQDDGSRSYPMALEDLYAEQFLAALRDDR